MQAMSRPPSVQFPADGTKRHGASVDAQTAVDVNLHDLYASQDSDVVQPWPVPSGDVQDAKTADASVEVESDVLDSLRFAVLNHMCVHVNICTPIGTSLWDHSVLLHVEVFRALRTEQECDYVVLERSSYPCHAFYHVHMIVCSVVFLLHEYSQD